MASGRAMRESSVKRMFQGPGLAAILLLCSGITLTGCSGVFSFLKTRQLSLEHYKTAPGARDVSYGLERLQTLDIYVPEGTADRPRPVLLFIHGGGWNFGDKTYEAVLLMPFVRRGMVVATMNYRLTPAARFPDQQEDCLLAITWLRGHIGDYGGDPGAINLVGHSAGAHLAALVAVEPEVLQGMGTPARSIRSCVALSGVYDLEWFFAKRVRGFIRDFVRSPEDARSASPERLLEAGTAPLSTRFLIAAGERDEPLFADQGLRFYQELRAKGARAGFLQLAGKTHGEVLQAMGDENSELFREMVEIFRD